MQARLAVAAVVLGGMLAGCTSPGRAPLWNDFQAPGCAASYCPASHWPELPEPTLGAEATVHAVGTEYYPVGPIHDGRWIVWDNGATHAEWPPRLVILDTSTGELWSHRTGGWVSSLGLDNGTLYFSAPDSTHMSTYRLVDDPGCKRPYGGPDEMRLHKPWRIHLASRATSRIQVDAGSVQFVSGQQGEALVRASDRPMCAWPATDRERMALLDVESGALRTVDIPVVFGARSNDSYLPPGRTGTVYWEEHAPNDWSSSQIRSINLTSGETRVLLDWPGPVTWFWVRPDGIMTTDGRSVTWHPNDGPARRVSTQGAVTSIFSLHERLGLAAWLETPDGEPFVAGMPVTLRVMDLATGTIQDWIGPFVDAWFSDAALVVSELHSQRAFDYILLYTAPPEALRRIA